MYIKQLNELGENDLASAGGKGMNLGILINNRFPVPPGFCITTHGYNTFIKANNLYGKIESLLLSLNKDDPGSVERNSKQIRTLFISGTIPRDLADEIRNAFNSSGFTFVAVRSSATAEDLPGMSFAGQQETFLNIKGISPLLDAVKECWASLWTARAIVYRIRNKVSHSEVSLAVVIQQMVQSHASGVMFTANPITGKRTETVIDAISGLGEALVSGMVEPDHFEVDNTTCRIINRVIGAKKLSIRGDQEGGTKTINETTKNQQALGDEQILELVTLGKQALSIFHTPQDIEWAWADKKMYIVQSRPITTLYPVPDCVPGNNELVLFSLGAVQGMLDPFTPLGKDYFCAMAAQLSKVFSGNVTIKTQQALIEAGMRLFLNFTPLFRSRPGRVFLKVFSSSIEPGSIKSIETLLDDPRFSIKPGFIKAGTIIGFLRMLSSIFFNTVRNILFPHSARKNIRQFIHNLTAGLVVAHAREMSLGQRIVLIEKTMKKIPRLFFTWFIPAVACGQAPMQFLQKLNPNLPEIDNIVMELTHGLPYNVTTEMDLLLWKTACFIKADHKSSECFRLMDEERLTSAFLQGDLPETARKGLDQFIKTYGMRGLCEIDIGRPRWKENPVFLIRMIKSYLSIEDPYQSPEAVFKRGIVKAENAGRHLIKLIEQTKGGKRKAKITSFLIKRVRGLVGLREFPKFAAIRIMTIMRDGLLVNGKELARRGLIEKPEDIFFLHLEDLKEIAGNVNHDWKAMIRNRKRVYETEKLRRMIPRILLSDGTCFYGGINTDNENNPRMIHGSPVSPGITEGRVHIILNPFTEHLNPGEILVCPGTDPSWTPLFLAAAGLVMEVGGMMTHGSVVAREYGIPAIVGVDQATTRLKTGQHIRIDGASGVIEIL